MLTLFSCQNTWKFLAKFPELVSETLWQIFGFLSIFCFDNFWSYPTRFRCFSPLVMLSACMNFQRIRAIYFASLAKLCFASVLHLRKQVLSHRRFFFSDLFTTRICFYILMCPFNMLNLIRSRLLAKFVYALSRSCKDFFTWHVFQACFKFRKELTCLITLAQAGVISQASAFFFLFPICSQLAQFTRFWPRGGSVLGLNLESFAPQSHALLLVPLPLENKYFYLKDQANDLF